MTNNPKEKKKINYFSEIAECILLILIAIIVFFGTAMIFGFWLGIVIEVAT